MDDHKVKIDQALDNGICGVEKIMDGNTIIAIILRKNIKVDGVKFFTPREYSQQLGVLVHKKGKYVSPHKHRQIKRNIVHTQEVLFIVYGMVKVKL